MFHQKQKGNYCRCHAINNLFGKELLTLKEFDNYCNEYDKKNNFSIGSSRNGHLFYNNGGNDNIFGYVMKKKGISVKMVHYDYYKNKKINGGESGNIGYIIYNRGHTYCVRIVNGEKWIIDSMCGSPQKIDSISRFNRAGFGVISVTRM